MNKDTLVSIIIVNWNGKKWLEMCLSSIKKQTYTKLEVIIVDNNSSDDSIEFIKKNYPDYKVIANKKNDGFAKGNNLGITESKGEYIILLNNDIYVEPGYVEKFINAFKEIPNLGIAQSKIIWMKDKKLLDGCGSFWTNTTFLYHYGFRKEGTLKQYNQSFPVFSVKGASMIVKKTVFEKIGLFDDDFWSYYEETDLCHRAWIAGFECWYYPKATIYHSSGESSALFDNSYIQYHNFKNKLLSYIKNFEAATLAIVIPTYLLTTFILALFYVLTIKFSIVAAILKAYVWNLVHFNESIQKRSKVKEIRKVSDKLLHKRFTLNPKPEYYYFFLRGFLSHYQDKEISNEK